MKPTAVVPRGLLVLAIFVLLLLPARMTVEAVPTQSAELDELPPPNPAAPLQVDQGSDDPAVGIDPQCPFRRRAWIPIVSRK